MLIRVINCKTQRTISEHFETKTRITPGYPHVSNKKIIEGKQTSTHTSVIYNPKNLDILIFCIMPVDKISDDERIFIQAILDELTKLFVIINSSYFNSENKMIVEDSPSKIKDNTTTDDSL